MGTVCRIVHSVDLNRSKYDELAEQARLLGQLRHEIWERFGSLAGVGADHRNIRDGWVKTRDFSPLPAKAWKETLRDTLDDIALYEAAGKEKVRRAIYARTDDKKGKKDEKDKKHKKERQRLYRVLRGNSWMNDPYLSRMMRKHKKHGITHVQNQIVLEGGVYSQFTGKDGNTWIKVPSFTRGQQISVPLNSKVTLRGCLRLILKDGQVFVHYALQRKTFASCGSEVLGVDKGYTEAFADSQGKFYGRNFGKVLTQGSDKMNLRGKVRNKLHQIAKKHIAKNRLHKARKLYRFNLGRKKLERFTAHQQELVRNIAFQAAHRIVDRAKEVRAEDLSSPIAAKQHWKAYNRRMSGWAKGALAEALESVTEARGSRLRPVNCAYTSQMDSNTHRLEGRRVGDKFYHVNGDVSQADTNAAKNIDHRAEDTEIGQFTPHRVVKKILLDRLLANGGVSGVTKPRNRPSMTSVARRKRTSTKSELPGNPESNQICSDF